MPPVLDVYLTTPFQYYKGRVRYKRDTSGEIHENIATRTVISARKEGVSESYYQMTSDFRTPFLSTQHRIFIPRHEGNVAIISASLRLK